MRIQDTALPGALIIEPKVFGDPRGYFLESYHRDRYRDAGMDLDFVQDNLSRSRQGTLRGLHFQNPHPQGKLVYVLEGEVFDVAVDVRADSPTFGVWVGVTLSGENKRQFYVPPGFAHGFCVTSETALFAYKCTDRYAPECECSILWCDEEIGIDWPVRDPLLSEKDKVAPRLRDIPRERLIFPASEAATAR
jgi:dTDP-4-dehydrorhamnose 3,5-epimerase